MKKLLFLIAIFLTTITYAQKPKVDAVRYKEVTTAQRNALTVPTGEHWKIYNITNNKYEYWNGTSWSDFAGGTGGHIIQNNGIALTEQPYLNFKGGGVIVENNVGNTSIDVTIPNAVLTAADITDFDTEVANNTSVALNTAKISDYEIQVGTGNVDDVQAALDTAGVIPVRITSDIIDLDRPILMNSNQTLIFEGYTIYVKTDVSSGGVDANIFFNGHAVIKNRNGIGLGSVLSEGGDWSGTGLGGETNITVIGGSIVGTGHIAYMYNGVQFHNVTNSRIENVKCVDVLTRTGLAQGNIDLRNSDNIFVKNISSTGTEKSGIWANDCDDLHINGGFITLSGDSGIAGETNERPVIENIIVDNCGLLPAPQGASNVTMDMRNGRFINNTILNASGTTNGYGLTLGHPNPDNAWNTVVSGNHFEGNAVNGIRLQGALTRGITIEGNTFINNGNGSTDAGAGGINFNAVSSCSATNNYFQNNRHGVITSNGATDITISDNLIEDSNQYGINLASGGNFIKNNALKGNLVVQIYDGGTGNLHVGNTHSDGAAYTTDIQETFTIKKTLPLDANLMTGSLLKLQPTSPSPSSAVAGASSGIAMQVDGRSGLYGVTASTFVGTSRTDFDYKIKAHKGTEAGVTLLSIDDVGNAAITGTVTASNLSGTNTGDQVIPTNSTFVDLTSPQTITGSKTFTSSNSFHDIVLINSTSLNQTLEVLNTTLTDAGSAISTVSNSQYAPTIKIKNLSATTGNNIIALDQNDNTTFSLANNGNIITNGAITANSFIKSGGTSSQFLKADGSTDSNVYASTSALNTWTSSNTFNPSSGVGILINKATNQFGLNISSGTGGSGIFTQSSGTANNITANQSITGTGFNYVGQNNGTNTFTVNKTGNVVAKDFTTNDNLGSFKVGNSRFGTHYDGNHIWMYANSGENIYLGGGIGSIQNNVYIGGGFLNVSGNVTANSFIKSGATNDDVLLGDGSTTSLAGISGGVGYSVYTALISQSSTAAPTAIVLENTLGGTVVWTRTGTGNYRATLSGAFTDSKTIIFITVGNSSFPNDDQIMRGFRTDNNICDFIYSKDSIVTDGFNISLEIRVYP